MILPKNLICSAANFVRAALPRRCRRAAVASTTAAALPLPMRGCCRHGAAHSRSLPLPFAYGDSGCRHLRPPPLHKRSLRALPLCVRAATAFTQGATAFREHYVHRRYGMPMVPPASACGCCDARCVVQPPLESGPLPTHGRYGVVHSLSAGL